MPHRGLEAAKTRLAPVLDPAEREALARTLLSRVLAVVHRASDDVVVISPSEALRPIVEEAGARLSVQRGMGLNAGLEQARAEAVADGLRVLLVLHGDLPNLSPEDVGALRDALPAGGSGGVAIAPDRAGTGTNGLAQSPADAIAFGFGVASLNRHREAATRAGLPLVVVERPGLAFDLDTPADLARWLELGSAA